MASLSAAAILGGYKYIQDKPSSEKIQEIQKIKYAGPSLTEIKSNLLDWQKYATDVTGVLCDDCDAIEKKIFQDIFLALLAHESKYNSQATSNTGARGLGQITRIIYEDMLQKHRAHLYIQEFLKIRDKDPQLLLPLPRPVREKIENFPKNPTDEKIADLASAIDFFARSSVMAHEDAKLDPHTNILLASVVFRIKYNQGNKGNAIEERFENLRSKLKGTKYELPKELKYGKHLQHAILALYHYNGDSQLIGVKDLEARDRYVYKVLMDYKNNTAGKIARNYKIKQSIKGKFQQF